jgi:hypothetical protein
LSRCVAVLNIPCERPEDKVSQCPKEGYFQLTTFQKKDGKWIRFNQDVFCESHAYEFSMYYSNYLGLKVIIRNAEIKPEKVGFS